jgi:ubiquitin carboxyl-terminal hydrolase 9/24
MFVQALAWELPNITTVRAIIRLAWAASSGNLQLLNATHDELHRMHDRMATKMPDGEDVLGMYDYPTCMGKMGSYISSSIK